MTGTPRMTVGHLNAIGDAVQSAAGEAEAGPEWFREDAANWVSLLRDIEQLVLSEHKSSRVSAGDCVSVPRKEIQEVDGGLQSLPSLTREGEQRLDAIIQRIRGWLGDAP